MLYAIAAVAGGTSVLSSWLGLLNNSVDELEGAKAKVRWYGWIATAVVGVMVFAGVVGVLLYSVFGSVGWVVTIARWLSAPMAYAEERYAAWRS